MSRTISAARVAALVSGFDRSPAYAGLARSLRVVIGDGRIPHDTRLPSERELTGPLGVSRTTVTRAYADLRAGGYAVARQGSGTYTRVPGGRSRMRDQALTPRMDDDSLIDLNCAASSAPPGVAEAYQVALAELPAYLSGHGYYPAGLPALQRAVAAQFDARGLPTEPEQVMVTPGTLAATAVAARALVRPGDRVVVEAPVYPNAPQAFVASGARLVPVPVDRNGWDVEALAGAARRLRPRAAYLIPDFQNPTGQVMSDAERADVARALARAGAVAVIDEAHHELALDGQSGHRPLEAFLEEYGGQAITVGGLSKVTWGGLRVGWLRAPTAMLDALTRARLTLDLGVPVVEQLVATHLFADLDAVRALHRERLRGQRDTLAAALSTALPDWEFDLPGGGLALWCRLPSPASVAVAAAAERLGLAVSPGPVFGPEGGFASYLRVPYTRAEPELLDAVERLREAWLNVQSGSRDEPGRRSPAMVA